MRTLLLLAFASALIATLLAAGPSDASSAPQYDKEGKILLPADYREWVYLSSGLGMTYAKDAKGDDNPQFTNVFVKPQAYRQFVATGKWPDKTMFVLEERSSGTDQLPNRKGHFQSGLAGAAAAVKDESRFKEKWAYFSFGSPEDGKLKTIGSTAFDKKMCFECHVKNGASDNTFVQFYPTLKPIAQAKGTYKEVKE